MEHRVRPSRFAWWSLLVLGGVGCVEEAEAPASDESYTPLTLVDGTPEANGVLRLLNDVTTTVTRLDIDVGLDRRAAVNLIGHRDGSDGVVGTADDDAYNTVQEVDDVAYVGPAAMDRLYAYALANGWIESEVVYVGIWEAVPFTADQVRATLELVNLASETELDVDVALDVRAAAAIVAARPIVSLDQLAACSYVGTTALTRLRDYAVAQGYGDATLPVELSVLDLVREVAERGEGSPHFGRPVHVARAIVTTNPSTSRDGNTAFDVADPTAGGVAQFRVFVSAAAGANTGFLSLFDDVSLTGTFTRYGDVFELLLDDGLVHAVTLNKSGVAYEHYRTIQAAWASTAANPEGAVRLVSSAGYTFMVPLPVFLHHPMWRGAPPSAPRTSGNEQDYNWNIAAQNALDAWLASR